MKSYDEFIAAKSAVTQFPGIDRSSDSLMPCLFPHQRDLVRWALRKGRAAIFADTGLGKTLMELQWAQAVCWETIGRVLILTPLAVAQQMVAEGERWGIDCAYRRYDSGDPITIANYEMMDRFDPGEFHGIVLDESSILKSYDGKTRTAIITTFGNTPYRLAATATPAPNDFTELGNHSEFLGVKTRAEMLAEYFYHDGGQTSEWTLKGHAVQPFWRWVASWGAVVRSPADLGHDATAYNLPPLKMTEKIIRVDQSEAAKMGFLFVQDAKTLSDQRATRRATMAKRVAVAAELVAGDQPSVIWCELNDEGDSLEKAIPGAVQVRGADSMDVKAQRLADFAAGKIRVLVTKQSIAGFGLNWQHCARMVFVGASHSYEQTYQAIRRCWRFGQKRPVEVFVIRAETEGHVIANYRRKEADAERLAQEMTAQVSDSVRAEVCGSSRREWNPYQPTQQMIVPSWVGQESEEVKA